MGASVFVAVAGLVIGAVHALRQRDTGVLVGGILLAHGQPLVGTAIGPDEDGDTDHLAAAAIPSLPQANLLGSKIIVALIVTPDAFADCATVVFQTSAGRGTQE